MYPIVYQKELRIMRKAVVLVVIMISLMGTGSLYFVANSAERMHSGISDTIGYGAAHATTTLTR